MLDRARRTLLTAALLAAACSPARAEVLVRWNLRGMPPPRAERLGIAKLVVHCEPGAAAVTAAVERGYRVWAQIAPERAASDAQAARDAGAAGLVIPGGKGANVPRTLAGLPVVETAPGQWPQVRPNIGVRRNAVVQTASRTAQPWLDSNAATIAVRRSAVPDRPVVLEYLWKGLTAVEQREGPRVEEYLLAIAEAGAFGADLILDLHGRLESDLVAGRPEGRAAWDRIHSYIDGYGWDRARTHTPIANVGLVARKPEDAYELLNLLARHNVPFKLLTGARVGAPEVNEVDLVVVPTPDDRALLVPGIVPERIHEPKDITNPNAFALEVRNRLGKEKRIVDVWNGITVLAAPYRAPDGAVLLELLNYAQEAQTVPVRLRGEYQAVRYENPERKAELLPFENENGVTQFVVPDLAVGGTVFMKPKTKNH
jgi:hypothetical protein